MAVINKKKKKNTDDNKYGTPVTDGVKKATATSHRAIVFLACVAAYGISMPLFVVVQNQRATTQTLAAMERTIAELRNRPEPRHEEQPPTPPSPPPPPGPHEMCVSKGKDLQEIIDRTTHVMFLMPAKAAGTSTHRFARRCNTTIENSFFVSETNWAKVLKDRSRLPPVSSHHVGFPHANNDWELNLLRSASKSTLFVWNHRDETSRLGSSIRHVLKMICLTAHARPPTTYKLVEYTDTKCTFREEDLVHKIIERQVDEIGMSTHRYLTCDTYRAIRNNLPNMIFTDYRNTDDLQKQIARKHCPGLSDRLPIRENVGDAASDEDSTRTRNRREVRVRTRSKTGNDGVWDDAVVSIDEWIAEKGPFLEMMLDLNGGEKSSSSSSSSCRGTTRKMETALASCDDDIVRIDEAWIGPH